MRAYKLQALSLTDLVAAPTRFSSELIPVQMKNCEIETSAAPENGSSTAVQYARIRFDLDFTLERVDIEEQQLVDHSTKDDSSAVPLHIGRVTMSYSAIVELANGGTFEETKAIVQLAATDILSLVWTRARTLVQAVGNEANWAIYGIPPFAPKIIEA